MPPVKRDRGSRAGRVYALWALLLFAEKSRVDQIT